MRTITKTDGSSAVATCAVIPRTPDNTNPTKQITLVSCHGVFPPKTAVREKANAVTIYVHSTIISTMQVIKSSNITYPSAFLHEVILLKPLPKSPG